jgi:hypothetical protein
MSDNDPQLMTVSVESGKKIAISCCYVLGLQKRWYIKK